MGEKTGGGNMEGGGRKQHQAAERTWKLHMRVSSTDIIAPALSNSPPARWVMGHEGGKGVRGNVRGCVGGTG
jgi:hypothetical protein